MNTRWQVTAGRLTQELATETDRAQFRYEASLRVAEGDPACAKCQTMVTHARLELQRLRSALAKARTLLDSLERL